MPDEIKEILFQQQRFQIMDIGVHHGRFTNAYLYAWEDLVYPFFEDTDGSILKRPHESFAEFFKVTREQVETLHNYFCDQWEGKTVPTFYELEEYFSSYDRGELIHICRYIYLQGHMFDEGFWEKLITPMQHPSEAASIIGDFDREKDIYFM
jgi:antitoxin MazE